MLPVPCEGVAAVSVQHWSACPDSFNRHRNNVFRHRAHERIIQTACGEVQVEKSDGGSYPLPPATTADRLTVVGMGVGTKFLSESVLQGVNPQQQTDNQTRDNKVDDEEESYGSRVRDCHAEVLARRAFRCHLSLEMKRLLLQQNETPQQGERTPIQSILRFSNAAGDDNDDDNT
jgi:hypothetical protein